MTMGSGLKKTATVQVTPVTAQVTTAQKPKTKLRSPRTTLTTWYYDYWMQFSMTGLAVLGLLIAIAHHLYNTTMNGQKVDGDPQWPPRYGNALAFLVKALLIGSVQIAYKQQAWVSTILRFHTFLAR